MKKIFVSTFGKIWIKIAYFVARADPQIYNILATKLPLKTLKSISPKMAVAKWYQKEDPNGKPETKGVG